MVMAIPGACLGIIWFEYSGDGAVVTGRFEFIGVVAPGLGIVGLTEICGVRFEYNGGSEAVGNVVESMAIRIPVLGSYLSLFTS